VPPGPLAGFGGPLCGRGEGKVEVQGSGGREREAGGWHSGPRGNVNCSVKTLTAYHMLFY